ncbi:hypothetical protein LTR17_022926 [Elasticomyces elasticus]|nr:hypothetical protein LTR17_022926 [Elasticomyces elasticus]
MASPAVETKMEEPNPNLSVLGKRKRDTDTETDDVNETNEANGKIYDPDDEDEDSMPQFRDLDDGEDDDEDNELNDDDADDDTPEDDDDEQQHIHVESSEAFPGCAIYDKDIPAIKKAMTGIPKKAVEVLTGQDCSGKHAKTHMRAAQALLEIPTTKRPKIALIGNAGVGKSSLLCAVTDMLNLAKSLSGGQSCTCVPTQYSSPFAHQTKQYAALIIYYNAADTQELLAGFLRDVETDEFEQDPAWDAETRQLFHRRAVSALKSLQVLFRDQEEFATLDSTREYLRSNYEDKSINALYKMVQSCEEKLKDKSIIDGSHAECCEASTRGKLRQAIDPFMNARANGTEPSLWPLVKQVCIGVEGSRVLDKVTIVDLPGISDTNETRIKVVRDYIKTIDHIWMVTSIGRVVDDALTTDMVYRYGKLFKGCITIIATKSDTDIDQNLAKELQKEGHDLQEWFTLTGTLKAHNTKVKTLKAELLQERKKYKKPTKPKLMEFQSKIDMIAEVKRDSKAIELRRFEVLVHARNAFVTEQLRANMDKYLPKGIKLQVFCISNRHYAAIKGGRSVRGLRLSAEATGVPALRAHALAIPAADQFGTLEDYYAADLGVFLSEAQLWVKVTQLERRAELLGLVREPLDKFQGRMETRAKTLKHIVGGPFLTLLSQQFSGTRDVAIEILGQKRKKHASTIMAFMRRNGNHHTSVCPQESWNEHFMKGLTDAVEEHWDVFENSRIQHTSQLRDALLGDMRAILPLMSEQHPRSVKVLPMTRLQELVDVQISSVNNIFRTDDISYSQDLRTATETISAAQCRNGVTKRSLDRMEAHLTRDQLDSPFTRAERSLGAALTKNDAKHMQGGKDSVLKRVNAVLEATFDAFDRLDDRQVDDPKERKAMKALQKVLGKMEETYRVVGEKLIEVKARYPA